MRYTNETWIAIADAKYPGRYSYEHTNYIDSYHKVAIECIKHKEVFDVSPMSFIKSSDDNFCPKCKITHNEIKDDESSEELFDLVKYYTDNQDKGNEPGIFYKLKVTHKPSSISFIKIGVTSNRSYKKYYDKKYDSFEFDILDEVHTTNINAAKLESEYKKENKDKRFYLPKNICFDDRDKLYEMDGYYQLISSQVKFIRDCLLEKQDGKCLLCKYEIKLPTLDHYHSKKQHGSGLVRGVLCNTCNRMVGVIENNLTRNGIDYSDAPDFLRNLANYLLDKRERYIHPTEKPKPPKLMKSSYNKLVKAVNGKQKVPKYTGKYTKQLDKLYEKYELEPVFAKSKSRG